MRRILNFRNFLFEKKGTGLYGLDESTLGSQNGQIPANGSLRTYIEKTGNKGGDQTLAEKISNSIISESSGNFFSPFFEGVPSICTLEIFKKVFGKVGLVKGRIDLQKMDEIIKSSQFLLGKEFPEMLKSWEQNKGFNDILKSLGASENKVINDLISPDIVSRIRENIENSDIVMDGLNNVRSIIESLNKDSIEDLDEAKLETLREIFSEAIADYQTASKIKSESPQFYKQCSELTGDDDADVSASLGSLGL